MLVEFEPESQPGWEIVGIQEELSQVFGGRPVDMVNPKYLNHRIRDRVLAEAEDVLCSVGMRNILAHDYLHVDWDAVYKTATHNVPALAAALEPLLPEAER